MAFDFSKKPALSASGSGSSSGLATKCKALMLDAGQDGVTVSEFCTKLGITPTSAAKRQLRAKGIRAAQDGFIAGKQHAVYRTMAGKNSRRYFAIPLTEFKALKPEDIKAYFSNPEEYVYIFFPGLISRLTDD